MKTKKIYRPLWGKYLSVRNTGSCTLIPVLRDWKSSVPSVLTLFFSIWVFDVVLLDLGLPDMNGFEIIREVRTWTSTPIIVISARTAEQEKVSALDLGADDYITKPFGTSELLARIRASLRHSNRLRTDSPLYLRPYRHGEMKLDFSKRLLTIGSQVVHLTPIEYKIVAYLAQNSGKVITYAAVLSNVWGPYADSDNKILRVNMANIRRKIEDDPAQPRYIFTEVGVGYRMAEDEEE